MLRRLILPMFALVAILSPLAMAQDNTGGAGAGGGGGQNRQRGGGGNGGGGGNNQQDWRQRFADRLKEDLGATDDEMKVIQPKIEKLMMARRDASGMGGFGRGGRGGPGGRGGDSQSDATPSPAEQASNDLRQTLENKSATPEEIAAKLKAVREARAKAKEQVTAAQKDLKEVLTQRQEAVLVNMGWLE
jgi:Spy/CpxP family protein refolding chaperone